MQHKSENSSSKYSSDKKKSNCLSPSTQDLEKTGPDIGSTENNKNVRDL